MQGMTRFDPEGKSFLSYQVRVVKVLWSGCLLVLLFRRQAAEVVLCGVFAGLGVWWRVWDLSGWVGGLPWAVPSRAGLVFFLFSVV